MFHVTNGMPHLQYILSHCGVTIIFLFLQKKQVNTGGASIFFVCYFCATKLIFVPRFARCLRNHCKSNSNQWTLVTVSTGGRILWKEQSREILLLLSSEIQSLIKWRSLCKMTIQGVGKKKKSNSYQHNKSFQALGKSAHCFVHLASGQLQTQI